jgi:NAD(P)-dependent dehydrogenase (short-subunit alcohol dehydrogenase family)
VDLHGKQTLITGAASGIGRATAIRAARKGARLVLTDINEAQLAATVREIGPAVIWSGTCDVSDHDAVVAMAAAVHAEHGPCDIVMNVAGIATWGSVQTLEHHHWQRVIDINLMGPISIIETFVGPMIEAGRGGHLVNVSSAAGLFGLPWHAAYSASKFGLRGVSEVLRFDLRQHRIGVTLVCPGGVDTGLVNTVDIVGLDRNSPTVQKMIKRFRAHAKAPEQVAAQIVAGVEKNKYLVLTSPDIWVGHFFQRKFALPYELAMRGLNRQFSAIARRASR